MKLDIDFFRESPVVLLKNLKDFGPAEISRHFAAYSLDTGGAGLRKIFHAPWTPGSEYEHPEYPIHTYSTIARDPSTGTWFTMVEAVDPTHSSEPGLNLEVDRVLLYASKGGA